MKRHLWRPALGEAAPFGVLLGLACVLFALWQPSGTRAAVIEEAPTADAYIQNGSSANSNFGSLPDLRVQNDAQGGNGKMAYVKFDLSNISDTFIKNATLRLYAKSKSAGDVVNSVFGAVGSNNDSWSESTINWLNSPNHLTAPLTYQTSDVKSPMPPNEFVRTFNVPAAGQYQDIDVTHAVASQFALQPANKHLTFMVAAPPGSPYISYSTREAAANPPVLSLVRNGVTTIIPVAADTYIWNENSSTNYGGATGAAVSNFLHGRLAYFRFDASSFAGASIDSATLKLYPAAVNQTNTPDDLYVLHDAWGDSTWADTSPTWSANSSAHDPDPSTYRVTDVDTTASAQRSANHWISATGQYYDFDVTDFINDRLLAGDKSISFMLADPNSGGSEVVYGAREDASHAPKLEVEQKYLTDNLTWSSDNPIDANGITYVGGSWGLMPNVLGEDHLLTYNGYQYATYYNAAGHVCVARRPLSGGGWQVAELSDYTLTGTDAHDVVAMGISPADGKIHLSFDQHAETLNYRKTTGDVLSNPGSVSWGPQLFGAVSHQLIAGNTLSSVTYPTFVTEPSGKLLFTFRVGTAGNGQQVLYEYTGGQWQNLGAVTESTGTYTGSGGYTSTSRSPYFQRLMYDQNGRLDATFTWREINGELNHDLMYMYSDDNGRTWKNNSAATVAQTGTADLVNVNDAGLKVVSVDENNGLDNCGGGMYALSSGVIHTVDIEADTFIWFGGANQRFYHHWRDAAGAWHTSTLNFSGSCPQVVATANAVYIAYVNYGKVCIAKATASNNFNDWQLIHTSGAKQYDGGVALDIGRFATSNVLSIFDQEGPAISGNPTPVHQLDYLVG
jgi:hypothetical protein